MAIKRILITGAGGSAGSNFIKSLRMSEEKFYLVGSDTNKYHLELVDGLDKKYLLPPAIDPSYIDKLNQLIALEKIELVHPQPDIEVAIIGLNRERVKARTLLPANKTIKLGQNKIEYIKQLKKSNIPVPQSFHLNNKNDLFSALNELLKEHEKAWLRATRGAGSKASLPIKDLEQGHQWIKYWITMKGFKYNDFMISEFLPGKEFAFQSIWKDGQIITSEARERIAYIFGNLTPSGQSSSPSVAKTVHRDDVNEIATKAVNAIDKRATGIFCIDMKENKQGIPCITEINCGRFFTTNDFFSAAGSNMPYYYIKMAYEEELPILPKYNAIPEGFYWIRMIDMGQKLVKGEKWTSIKI
jgi:carbamoyl-phosphate synthase large subunit